MRLNKKIAGYFALAFVAFLALLFLALPPLIRHIAVQKIDEATGRKSQIAKISLNPFTLTAGITGVRLSEKGSAAPFFALSSARLSLSPLSLPKRSFIVTELQLSSPYLHVVRNAPNSFNFSDLMAGKKEQKKGGTPLFSVNNITLSHGSIDFQDKALSVEKRHTVRGMNISVPFFSNMPYLADRYVTPHFSAVVNGSPVRFDGQLKPLTRAVEASIALNVKRLDLPFYLGYLPFPLPVKVSSGHLTTALELGYRVDEKIGPEVRVTGTIALERLAVNEPNGASLAALERAELKIKEVAVFSRRIDISSLELDGIELFAARDLLGVWNFQKLGERSKPAETKTATPEPAAKPADQKPLELKLAKLSLKGAKVHLTDGVPKGGFRTDFQDIDFGLEDFSLAKGHQAPFDLKLRSSRGETLTLKGNLAAAPLDMKATLALNGVPLKDYYPYLVDTLASPVSGTLGISTEIAYNDAQGLVLDKGALKLGNLSASFGGSEGVRLREATAGGIRVDLKQKKATVAAVDLKSGSFILSSGKDGTISAKRLLKPAKGAPSAKAAAPARTKRGAGGKAAPPPPFSYRIEKVTGSELGIKFTDHSKEEEPAFALNRLRFSLSGISGPRQGPIPFTLATGFQKAGRIAASGSVSLQPLRFKGNLELHGIPLTDFDPYLPENVTVFIADGALDTKLSLNIEQAASGLKGSFGGSLGVRSFYCQDTTFDEDLLKWESLQIEKVNGTLGPFTLAIKDVALSNFYSRIIVEKDGTMNVQHLTGEEPQGAQAPAAAAQAKQPPAAQAKLPAAQAKPQALPSAAQAKLPARSSQAKLSRPAAPAPAGTQALTAPAAPGAGESVAQPHPISIDTVTVQGGTLAFSDRHLAQPFDTTFFNLGGRVSGLSSQTNRLADVDLRGNLENHSPLSIKGSINPLRGDLFLDLKVTFNDIELSPLTPYADTYLGYNVDKGKLFLDLSYRIDKKKLSSQNKVFIDQFSFGKQVDSPKATKLPVRLAIALLKDRKGEIHLDLPVAGQTDDPKFDVWKVVLQILKNLLVKAATSPFALLGSMFGGTEDFSAVYFAPGSDQLTSAEQGKLAKLSQALHDRPALNMEISGFVDREPDAEGYRNEQLLKKMKGEKFRALVKQGKTKQGETQENMEILPQEYPVYLKAVYVKEKFPKPRTALGFLKDLPEAEMKKLILTHTVVGNNELQALARERAEAVKAYLLKEGKVPAERLFEKSADIFKPASKEAKSGSRVEFGASVK
jgi:hypothetical protein